MFQKPNTTGRPVIEIKWGPIDLVLEGAALLVLIVAAAMLLYEYPSLPDQIPTHFNAEGVADDYGSKSSLFAFLGFPVGMYLLLTLFNKNPSNFNYPLKITEYNAPYQYRLSMRLLRWIKLAMVINFVWMLYSAIQVAKSGGDRLSPAFVVVFLASVFVPIVVYFYLANHQPKSTS